MVRNTWVTDGSEWVRPLQKNAAYYENNWKRNIFVMSRQHARFPQLTLPFLSLIYQIYSFKVKTWLFLQSKKQSLHWQHIEDFPFKSRSDITDQWLEKDSINLKIFLPFLSLPSVVFDKEIEHDYDGGRPTPPTVILHFDGSTCRIFG